MTWLPKAEPDTPHLSVEQLEKIQADLTAKDEAATAAKAKLSQTQSELAKLKEQLALLQEVKETNKKTIDSGEYSEAQTRELIIDVMLREAGWNPKAENCEEYEVLNCMPTATGKRTGYIDYVLWGDDNKPLALVEAKRTRSDPQIGQRQADLYADCLEKHHGQRPIIYYSNGYTTWMWDDQFYPPREVQEFSTRDELQWKINQRSSEHAGRQDLSLMQPKKEITGRYYQMEAAARVALVTQAKREFNKHLPHVSVASLLDKTQEDARVLFSTYPTMLNCIDGAIFDYFDSLLLGLTATPRGEVDRNTYKLFELEDHQPSYSYELEQAVNDGFLVPPRAISVPLKFQREGIKYKELSAEEQDDYELQEEFYDKETGELKEEIGSAALNQWLFNKDTVNKVLMHLMENGIKVEGGDKLGKTIIFAKNAKHAKFIVEQFDLNYPAMAGKFCRQVDYSVKYVQSLIDDFSIKNRDPYIVASADNDDEYSRRFDLLILNLQAAILQNSQTQENYQIKVQEIAKGLEDKSAIPNVAAQMELILALQTDPWWSNVSLPLLEDVRTRLRGLTRFIDKGAGLVDVFTNFKDKIGEESAEYNIVKSDPKLKDYRKRVQRFINEHRDHVTIRRLRNNEPISPTDVSALEDILFAEDGAMPREEYEKIFGEKPLGVLVRSVVGLNRNAAKAAFSDFLSEASLHPDQMAFLNEIVEYLVKNGIMELNIMFEAPFTHIHDQGVAGVFGDDMSNKVIELVRYVNKNADVVKIG